MALPYYDERNVENQQRRLQQQQECALDRLLGLDAHGHAAGASVRKLAAHVPSSAGAFAPLVSHPGSKTLLQDAFVRFHHLLYQHDPPLLPLHEWGARGIKNRTVLASLPGWTKAAYELGQIRPTGHARPSVLPRLAMNGWLLGQAARTRMGSVCLGWDNTEYIDVMAGCSDKWAFVFEPKPGKRRVDVSRRLVLGDLTAALPAARGKFDAIVCNQVFEHVDRPHLAIAVLAAYLKPDGLLYWSAPFTERFHLIPGDYYRFTVLGARTLLTDAGLQVLHTQRWGDSMITSGYTMGFGAGDFDVAYLERHMLQDVSLRDVKWLERKPQNLYINVGVVAQKESGAVR